MNRTMSFYDLRDALAQPGCAVCRLRVDAADRFLENLLWESVNDPARRREIRQARGFCREHAWGLVRAGASLGVAIVMRDVLQSVLEVLEGASFEKGPSLSLRGLQETLGLKRPTAAAEVVAQLEPPATCPACVWVEKVESVLLDTLVRSLTGEESLLAAYEASDGLCLPHFRRALARVRGEANFEALVSAQRLIWERLIGQLNESIRKSDYRFLGEDWEAEEGAWLRAITAIAGARLD